jgi:putative oxidoreductase
MDTGVFLLRVVIGLFFAGHGTQKLFGWFGGHGIEGTGGFFHQLGYRPGKAFATLAGLSEFFGGVLLALGLFTPLAAAAIIGVMFNAVAAVHGKNGPWVTDGGWEYPAVLAAAVAAIAFIGPGVASLDNVLDLYVEGTIAGVFAIALGMIAGAATDVYRRVASRSPRFAGGRDVHATA